MPLGAAFGFFSFFVFFFFSVLGGADSVASAVALALASSG